MIPETLRDINEAVALIKAQGETVAQPSVFVLPRRDFLLLDRVRVRWGWMPASPEGERYARRLRRMARKKRRGWA